jgi:tRNA U34 5-methylaminomethyl-2-thiouridine-forming methyltransferase MnmC
VSAPGDFELVTLRNGARAVRHLPSGEVMHPSVGPWAEAMRLYVEQPRLAERLCSEGAALRVLDVGLGAGTNALAALEAAHALGARRRRGLEIVSLERDLQPLRLARADAEGFPHQARWSSAVDALLETGVWEEDGLSWRLIQGELPGTFTEAQGPFDLVCFDPFSPHTNPGLWTADTLRQVLPLCRREGEGALLLTYSAATPTRVSLLLAGFFVGTGWSIGTKKETTVAATCLESLESPLEARWLLRWERSDSRAPHGEPLTPELEAAVRGHPQFASR